MPVAYPDLHLTGGGGGGGGAFEGLTINIEFCEDNSGRSKKTRYFRKIRGGGGLPLDPPLDATAADDDDDDD